MAKGGVANRNTAKYNIEKQYICFLNSELDFAWNESEKERFLVMWDVEGIGLEEISIRFNRHPWETGFLYLSLADQDRVVRRATEIIFSDVGEWHERRGQRKHS